MSSPGKNPNSTTVFPDRDGFVVHVHNVDEWFFVFSGAMDMQLGERHVTTTAGDSIWIPRGTDHAFTTTRETHVLNGYAPGGLEQIIAGIELVLAQHQQLGPDRTSALSPTHMETRLHGGSAQGTFDTTR